MNHKQKLGYMALGAGILAIGIIIGQFITPDIEAQNNGVFDEITCRSLKVIDENGNDRILLYSLAGMTSVSIMNHMNNEEKEAIALTNFTPFNPDGPFGSENSNSITIFKPAGTEGIEFNAEEIVNYVKVRNKAGKVAILLGGAEDDSGITIYDKTEKRAVRLDTAEDGNGIVVYGYGRTENMEQEAPIILKAGKEANIIKVNGKVGKEGVSLFPVEGLGIVIFDRAGTPEWIAP